VDIRKIKNKIDPWCVKNSVKKSLIRPFIM
jgi:hypothetical protein